MAENVENLIEQAKAKLEKLSADYSLVSGPELILYSSTNRVILRSLPYVLVLPVFATLMFMVFLSNNKLMYLVIALAAFVVIINTIYQSAKKYFKKTPKCIISEEGLTFDSNFIQWADIEEDKFNYNRGDHDLSFKCTGEYYYIPLDELNVKVSEFKFAYYYYKLRYLQKNKEQLDNVLQDLIMHVGGPRNQS